MKAPPLTDWLICAAFLFWLAPLATGLFDIACLFWTNTQCTSMIWNEGRMLGVAVWTFVVPMLVCAAMGL